jgi:hypothetical protein
MKQQIWRGPSKEEIIEEDMIMEVDSMYRK